MTKKTKNDEKISGWRESLIERHDLYNFESKIDYTLETTEKKETMYLLATYLFIPNSLHINKDSYSREQFFSDINNYIRFKTPKMTIDGIIDERNELSPMNIILKGLKDVEYGNSSKDLLTKIQRELCLNASIIKATLRDQFRYIQNNYHSFKKQFNIWSI